MTDRFERGAEAAAANSAALAEIQAASTLMMFKLNSLVKTKHRVRDMSRETRKRLTGVQVLIANLCASLMQ